MKKLAILLFAVSTTCWAQENKKKDYESGKLELGLRSTLSAFGNEGIISTGAGGHFRLRLGSRLNTEWFADYIHANLGGLGSRTDAHVGWAVMGYPLAHEIKSGALLPYIMGGHCFDYTRIEHAVMAQNFVGPMYKERWSSAIHMGLGTHYYLTHNFNVSLAAQYMIHLGTGLNARVIDDPTIPDTKYLYVEEGDLGIEGHLFLSLSVNLYMGDLWGRKKS